MKKIVFALFLLFTFCNSYSQITYTPQTAAGYQFKYIKADSGLALPFIDTSLRRGVNRIGAVVARPQDSLLYYWTGVKWSKINADVSGLISLINSKVDSVTVYGDELKYWVNGTSTLYNLSTISGTLNSVTTNGNTTANTIEVGKLVSGTDVEVAQATGADVLFQLVTYFGPTIGSPNRSHIRGDSISNDNEYYLPDTTGMFVLSVNGTKPNRKGNVIIAAGGGSGTDSSVVAGFGLTKNVASNVINLKVDTSVISTPYDLTVIDNKISSKIIKPLISDAEDNKPSLDLIQKSTNSYTRGWVDGQVMWVYNDTLRTGLGWFTGNILYDTIYRSTDEGATWQKESFSMPYPAHTVSYTQGIDGYLYIIGGDPFTTLTQRSTVSRSSNGGRTWETMTTTAPFISILGSAFMDEQGNLYYGGGQNDIVGTGSDTLWKSTDGGATWSIYATGMTILSGNTSNLVKYFNGRCVLATGGIYNPPSSTYTKKTYSFDINNPTAWVEHEDVPSATGLQYANAIVFDGKYWLIQGSNASGNTNNIYYLDKNFKWNTYFNYTDNIKANVLPVSHANGIAVYRNKIIVGVGNDFNATYALEPSKYQTYTNFRDSIKVGNLTHLSQIEGSFATLLGYNVKAGFANNTIRRISNAEVGNYYSLGSIGHYWGRLSTGNPINTDIALTDGMAMKLNSSGELLLTNSDAFDAGAYKLQVSGASHFTSTINAPFYAGSNALLYVDGSGNLNNGSTLTYNNRLSIGGTGSLVYPPTYGISSLATAAGSSNGASFTNTSTTGYNIFLFGQNTSNYGAMAYWNSAYSGNYAGTSVPFATSTQIQSGSANNQNLILSSNTVLHNVGVTSTNAGFRSDANGLRIGRNSNLHTSNTVQLEVEGTLKFNTGNQGAGKLLQSDASGNADWVIPGGTISNKSANYTITSADNTINTTTSAIVITLPTAVGINGQEFTIINSSSGNITIATTSSQLIGNFTTSTTYTLASDKSITVKSDNSNYKIKISN